MALSTERSPQYQMLLLVMSASRRAWNSYDAHQPWKLATTNQTLTRTNAPMAVTVTRTASARSPSRNLERIRGAMKNNGHSFRHPPMTSRTAVAAVRPFDQA